MDRNEAAFRLARHVNSGRYRARFRRILTLVFMTRGPRHCEEASGSTWCRNPGSPQAFGPRDDGNDDVGAIHG